MAMLSMMATIRLAALLASLSPLSLAATTWSGSLVDAKCYSYETQNMNPADTETAVDRDQNAEIRYCSPTSKTRSFVFVKHDGWSFALDPAGNAKAAQLVQQSGKKSPFPVLVSGQITKQALKVDSISLVQ